jgi:D-inositol-3-phosphate glycosyltransferase
MSGRGGALGRVALVSEHASPLATLGGVDSGGQNVYVGQLARHLAARGWHVDVLTRRADRGADRIVPIADGARVVHIDAGPPERVRKEMLLPFMPDFVDGVLVFCRREGRPYDLLHANFFMSALVAAEVKRALGTPFVVTFHALGRVRRIYQGAADGFPDVRFSIEERAAAEADRIIAECPQDEDDLVTMYGGDPSRIRIVPCGFDPGELWPVPKAEARRRLGISAEERVVLQLGRMVPRKGVEDAIRGFARVVRDQGIDARMLVVGGETDSPDPVATPEIGRLVAVADEEGIMDAVTFTGNCCRDRLRDYYSAADVFVTLPWYEPFGITPVEAMACGTPVVGSAVGGVKYSIVDGETGYLVPPRDPDAVAEKLARLLTDEPLRALLARQCVRRANRLFTWAGVAEEVSGIYAEVLGSYGRAGSSETRQLAAVDAAWLTSVGTMERSRELLRGFVVEAANQLAECFIRGGKVLIAGNGGSDADAQHMAAEFLGRYLDAEREGLPAMALTANGPAVTAWSNDVGFEDAFARQVRALGRRDDVLVGISTSGDSRNLVRAFAAAHDAGMSTIALLGREGGALREHADIAIVVPSRETPRIQEVHGLIVHLLCGLVEDHLAQAHVPIQTAEAQPAGI